MLETLSQWVENAGVLFNQHTALLAVLGAASFILLVVSLLASPWLLAKFPVDYFSKPVSAAPQSALQILISIIRTALGLLLVMAGIIMFVTPGPGLVFLVIGLALCEFPGKHTLLSRLVSKPSVLKTLNWLRAKAKKPPFDAPSYR